MRHRRGFQLVLLDQTKTRMILADAEAVSFGGPIEEKAIRQAIYLCNGQVADAWRLLGLIQNEIGCHAVRLTYRDGGVEIVATIGTWELKQHAYPCRPPRGGAD